MHSLVENKTFWEVSPIQKEKTIVTEIFKKQQKQNSWRHREDKTEDDNHMRLFTPLYGPLNLLKAAQLVVRQKSHEKEMILP